MKMNRSQECTIRSGFPIIVNYCVAPAEPDVGIMQDYIYDYEFTNLKGKSVAWLKITKEESDSLLEQLNLSGD